MIVLHPSGFRLGAPLRTALLLLSLVPVTAGAVGNISPHQLAARIENGSAPFILDVRTPEEFAEGHVPGAVNIPLSDLAVRASEIMPYVDREIVVYCAVGPRAFLVGQVMERNGFSRVLDLEGHMYGWVGKGLPVNKPD